MRLSSSLYLCLVTAHALLADQVTLKNGDRLSGAILKNDGTKLTMKSELAGDVTIAWAAITAVSAPGPLHVGLKDGKTVVGAVSTQAYTDPGLGPLAIELLTLGHSPEKVLKELGETEPEQAEALLLRERIEKAELPDEVRTEAERELILKTLERAGNNKAEAARQLGVDVKTIYNKLKSYGIDEA